MNKELDAQQQKSKLMDNIYDICLSKNISLSWEDAIEIGNHLHERGFFQQINRTHVVRYLQNDPIMGIMSHVEEFVSTIEFDRWKKFPRNAGYEITITQHLSRPIGEWTSEMENM